MSSRSRSSPVQLGNIEDALREALGADVSDCSQTREEEVDSGDRNDKSLAELFVSHEVGELKAKKLARTLAAREQSRAEKRRQIDEERSLRVIRELQLFDLLPGSSYSTEDVRKVLKHHNYDVTAAYNELHSGTLVMDDLARKKTKEEPVLTLYATTTIWPSLEQSVAIPRQSPSPRGFSVQDDLLENIQMLEKAGKKKFAQCNHHQAQADRFKKNSRLAGAVSAIARDERRQAEDYYHEANKLIARQLGLSLNLHGYTIERTRHLLKVAISALRKYRPESRCLVLIPGRGLNNQCKQPILKQAIMQWLKQEEIQYKCPSENEGVIEVDLYSVPFKFGHY